MIVFKCDRCKKEVEPSPGLLVQYVYRVDIPRSVGAAEKFLLGDMKNNDNIKVGICDDCQRELIEWLNIE